MVDLHEQRHRGIAQQRHVLTSLCSWGCKAKLPITNSNCSHFLYNPVGVSS